MIKAIGFFDFTIRYINVRKYGKTLLMYYICKLFRLNPIKND